MNLEAITLEDCIRRFVLEEAETIIKAGHVVGFVQQKGVEFGYEK